MPDAIHYMCKKAMRHAQRGEEIVIEPGKGETYATGKPTVYAYGVYEESSVLAGQRKRTCLGELPDGVTPKFFKDSCRVLRGTEVEILENSQWHENFNTVDHLPDGPDLG